MDEQPTEICIRLRTSEYRWPEKKQIYLSLHLITNKTSNGLKPPSPTAKKQKLMQYTLQVWLSMTNFQSCKLNVDSGDERATNFCVKTILATNVADNVRSCSSGSCMIVWKAQIPCLVTLQVLPHTNDWIVNWNLTSCRRLLNWTPHNIFLVELQIFLCYKLSWFSWCRT